MCVCVYRRLAAKDTELNAKMAKIEELRTVKPKSQTLNPEPWACPRKTNPKPQTDMNAKIAKSLGTVRVLTVCVRARVCLLYVYVNVYVHM